MPLCPVCHVAMVQVEEEEVVAQVCATCRGTWISAKALRRRVGRARAAGAEAAGPGLAELAARVSTSDSKLPLECPMCRQTMAKTRFHPKIPVQIDRCAACDHLWLDGGEQGLLLRLYAELLASQPEVAARQQQHLDYLRQPPQTTLSAGHSDRMDLAMNIGGAVVSVLLDLLLSPRNYHRGWW